LKPEHVNLKYINEKVFPVQGITHEPLSAGQTGALSAMGRINLEGGASSTPKSIVCKCLPRTSAMCVCGGGGHAIYVFIFLPTIRTSLHYVSPLTSCSITLTLSYFFSPEGFGERLFTDGTRMFYKEILFYRLLSDELPMRVPKMYGAEFKSSKGQPPERALA
jgi:hypothetical protein